MNGEVIKSFLVGLGFGVDDASLAKFNKAIASATVKVVALYASIKASAAGIFYSIAKISEGFEEMGYNLRLVAPAVNKMLILRAAMLDAYKHAGVDLTKVVKQSILFNLSLAKTKFALEATYKSVGARFLPLLTKQMDIFRQKIFANMPKIQAQLERFVKFVFKAFEATTILGNRLWSILGRVWDFFVKLDETTGGWSTKLLGLLAVWKFLNLAFLKTPLGMLLTGLLALLALYDDFKVWQEGGESLINWGSDTTRMIIGMTAVVAGLSAVLYGAVTAYYALSKAGTVFRAIQLGINAIMLANPFGLILIGVSALLGGLVALDAKWNLFGGHIVGFFKSIGSYVEGMFGGAGAHAGVTPMMQPQPALPASSSNNSNIHQETNVLVQGSADALSTGRAVAGEQGKVNADMTRNLKGALR